MSYFVSCVRLAGLFAAVTLSLSVQALQASPVSTTPPVVSRGPQRAIPIQIVNSNAGRVMTAHAERYDNKIYVDGVVFRPMSPGLAAHVHVWGVDKKNRQVFFKTDFVYFTGKPSLEHTQTYQVSISPETYAKAAIVYVTFHSQGDAESRHEDY